MKTLIDKIEQRIERIPFSGCWIWMGATTAGGYGVVRHEGKLVYVHRVMLASATGVDIDGINSLHECDTPPCCNPHHLFPGTQLDNMRDMSIKGRGRQLWDVCGSGHVMDDENSYFAPSGVRQCRACKARRDHAYKQARKAK